LSRVLISRIVLPRLFAKPVKRYVPTLSSGLVAVVHLLFGVMSSIRNILAENMAKGSCRISE
jgi:hypothetical protein